MSSNEMQQAGDSYYEGHPTGMEDQMKKMQEEMLMKTIDFQRLCHEILEVNPDGIALWEAIEENFLLPTLCNPSSASFKTDVIYYEGLRQGFRHLKGAAAEHKKRINGGR